jgi:transposase InsO family protein
MYRILGQASELRERRDELRHPNYQKPQLLATARIRSGGGTSPKLLGPVKWAYFYLYVILDIFSRCSIQDARGFCQRCFLWYDTERHHSGIGLLTPEMLHYAGRRNRQPTPSCPQPGFERNPERFARVYPRPPARPTAVWINPPPARAA